MKGVVLSRVPEARLVDVSHEVAPQDIMEAAFLLKNVYPYYPAGTIHVVVVDPGVGTGRKAVGMSYQGHYFIGPDNGLFSLILSGQKPDELVELNRPAFWRTPTPCDTFHGRDIFSPIAAHLAQGLALSELGTPIQDVKPLHWAYPIADDQGIRGWITHIDRFGNCISNIEGDLLTRSIAQRPVKCYVGSTILSRISRTYGEMESGEELALIGSHGFLEIAVNGGNAASLLGIGKGTLVSLVFSEQRKSTSA